MHSKTKKVLQLVVWVGLLCVETVSIVAFYVVPEFQSRNAPEGHWEMEHLDGPWLLIAAITLLGGLYRGQFCIHRDQLAAIQGIKVDDLTLPSPEPDQSPARPFKIKLNMNDNWRQLYMEEVGRARAL